MPSSVLGKRLLVLTGLGLIVLLLFGFVVGAVGSELFNTDRLLGEPEVHLAASSVYPTEAREEAARGGNLGYTGLGITNSMLSSWLTTLVLVIIFVVAASRRKLIPGRFQGFVELIIESLLNFVEGVAGKSMARKFFPIIATVFLFVLFNAWMGLLPIYPALGFKSSPEANAAFIEKANEGEELELHGVIAAFSFTEVLLEDDTTFVVNSHTKMDDTLTVGPESIGESIRIEAVKHGEILAAESIEIGAAPKIHLLRPAGTDVNMPLALAIVAFIFIEYWGLRSLGFSYLTKFFRFGTLIHGPSRLLNGPIDVFVGMLEGLSEVIRVVSFTFRLFGNMLAGKLLILVSAFLVPFVFSIPFYGLELLVGFIQAMIFAGLTLTFATVAIAHHEE